MIGNFISNKSIELVKYYVLASNIVYLIMYSNEGLHQLFTFIFVSFMFIYQTNKEEDNSVKSEDFEIYEAIIFSGEQDDNEINYKFDLNSSYILNVNVDCTETYIYLLSFNENEKNIKLTSKCLLNSSNEKTGIDLVIFNKDNTIKITSGVTDCVLDVKITKLL